MHGGLRLDHVMVRRLDMRQRLGELSVGLSDYWSPPPSLSLSVCPSLSASSFFVSH